MAEQRFAYGGQAVIEGVMIRGKHVYSVATRHPSGEISTVTYAAPSWLGKGLRKIPVIRGSLVLIETLLIGMKSLTYSAQIAAGGDEEERPISTVGMVGILSISALIGISLFFVLPVIVVHAGVDRLIDSSVVSNVSEGIIRLGIFAGYLVAIGMMADMRRMYSYHAAEHMAVHAYEAKLPLVEENVVKFPAAHPRCGTAFLLTVMVVSIFVFALLGKPDLTIRILSRIVLLPVVAGLSYEFIRYSALHGGNPVIRAIMSPNLLLQKVTTRTPDASQIEVAIFAI